MNLKYLSGAVALSLAVVLSPATHAAAEVEITWQNPEDYRDVRPANESRKRFRERVFAQLDEYVADLAEKLPAGHTLNVTVNDLDLAGRVWPASFIGLGSGGSDVRLIKGIDIPRMAFSYTLTDNTGAVLKTADVQLKDMSFQHRGLRALHDDDPLRYEKNMLRRWFDKEFPEFFAQQDA